MGTTGGHLEGGLLVKRMWVIIVPKVSHSLRTFLSWDEARGVRHIFSSGWGSKRTGRNCGAGKGHQSRLL